MSLRSYSTLALALLLVLPSCNDDGGGDESMGDGDSETGDGDGDPSGDGDGDPTGDGDGDPTGDGDGDPSGDGDPTGDGDGDGDGDPSGDGDGDEAVEFAAVHQILTDQGCTAGYCHGGGQGGLMMTDEATSYANLVDVDATMPVCGLVKRVVPGDPESSIMWMRARPIAMDMGMPCTDKMPQGSDGLSDADAQVVFDWIAGGALP